VQNLLDMSRIQAGVPEPRCTVAALTDLVTSVVSDLAPALRGHAVHVGLPPVTDRGTGASPDRLNHVSGLFVRRAGDAGAGLGFAIAKTFVEAHGQRIWAEDAPGAAHGSASRCRSPRPRPERR
jgi:K+-sensing histidine kinase KdpD